MNSRVGQPGGTSGGDGSYPATSFVDGDVLELRVDNITGAVMYIKNGALLYQSTVAPSGNLYFAADWEDASAALLGIEVLSVSSTAAPLRTSPLVPWAGSHANVDVSVPGRARLQSGGNAWQYAA